MTAVKVLRALPAWIVRTAKILTAAVLAWACWEVYLTAVRYPRQQLRGTYLESTRIYDREGRFLREAVNGKGERARWSSLDEMSPLAVQALIATEDERFFQHGGVDLWAVLRALFHNAQTGEIVSGASTLTMQLARLLEDHPRTAWGKLRQAWDAIRIERGLSKREILEGYLNWAPFGGGTRGLESACERYFQKPSSHLSPSEAAFLIGLLQAPGAYDPFKAPEKAENRRRAVLSRWKDSGSLAISEFERALVEVPRVVLQERPIRAGHFTDYVLARHPGGGKLLSTLDGGLQGLAEALVRDHVDRYRRNGISNAAVVVLDNASADILAMVGSHDWEAPGEGAVNGALALRQPGSTLKPFAYALAFEKGFTPASMLADVETEYLGTDKTLYIPQNYTRSFRGPVLAKEALGYSLNIPAIRLVRSLGVRDFLGKLKDLGFDSLNQTADYYGLGLVLGNGEVSLLQLAGAYAAIASQGTHRETRALSSDQQHKNSVFSAEAAYLVTAILADENLRIQAFGPGNPLLVGFPMAIKTGTSNNWRDDWVVGYTQEFTLAVWAGNFNADSTNQLSGSLGAGPLFFKMAQLLGSRSARPPELPSPPASVRVQSVCAESGQRPTELCPETTLVPLGQKGELAFCGLHRRVEIDLRNGLLATGRTPKRYIAERVVALLPPEFDSWAKEKGLIIPRLSSPLNGEDDQAGLRILRPREGDIYIIEPGYDPSTQTIEFLAENPRRDPSVSWLLNGKRLKDSPWPYADLWTLKKGRWELAVSSGGRKSDPVRFEVR